MVTLYHEEAVFKTFFIDSGYEFPFAELYIFKDISLLYIYVCIFNKKDVDNLSK